MRSLRTRAIVWGIGLALVSMVIGGVVLFSAFDAIALRRFDDVLRDRHLQVIVALASAGPDDAAMAALIADPAYDRPESGRYWQVSSAAGEVMTSRSMFDSVLSVPAGTTDRLGFSTVVGPDGELRLASQEVRLEDGSEWTVIVGESLAALAGERALIRNTLVATFLLVSLLGLGNAMLQTSAVLRPLTNLRKDILQRWDTDETLDPASYPAEVAPLVSDINALLLRNHDMFERTRRQGADLAHALKTPSAILRNELEGYRQIGCDTKAGAAALDRIDAQILRSLARLRAVNAAAVAFPQTEVRPSVERLARLFRSLPKGQEGTFDCAVASGHVVAMDHHDLEEVIGNLLENAFRWRRKTVRLSTSEVEDSLELRIEDDGPGIEEMHRDEALRAGGRLDERSKGTGLGLAIARDLVEAYGGTLGLGRSAALGGLCVTLVMPARGSLGKVS